MRTLSAVLTSVILTGVLVAVEPPRVTSVAPSSIVASAKPQALRVTGTGFAPGLTVEVTTQGNTETFSGAAIRGQASTGFEISMVLAQPGEASLIVRNTDGGVSDPFLLKVEAGRAGTPVPASQSPSIDRVTPDRATKGSTPQPVTFSGNHFVQGLSVSMTDPTGSVTVIKGTAIDSVTREMVKVNVVLDIAGEYTFLITNVSGQSSNSVTVIVS